MSVRGTPSERRSTGRVRALVAIVAALAIATTACDAREDDATVDASDVEGGAIEFRDGTGPRVDAPDRAMAMTIDAVETHGDDILVRIRVENADDGYLDMGADDTIYGPLLVMHDDRGNRYDSYAVEPAGVPGRRVADLSFRLVGPLDRAAESFTLELATQRGPLASPSTALPEGHGVRWQVDEPSGSEPAYAAPPRLPDLIHFWLETDPLPTHR
jgi:hypothetical protein